MKNFILDYEIGTLAEYVAHGALLGAFFQNEMNGEDSELREDGFFVVADKATGAHALLFYSAANDSDENSFSHVVSFVNFHARDFSALTLAASEAAAKVDLAAELSDAIENSLHSAFDLKKAAQTLSVFLMGGGQEGKTDSEMRHWTEGYFQSVRDAFGNSAENEIREEFKDEFSE